MDKENQTLVARLRAVANALHALENLFRESHQGGSNLPQLEQWFRELEKRVPITGVVGTYAAILLIPPGWDSPDAPLAADPKDSRAQIQAGGRRGGKSRSRAKQKAARANGDYRWERFVAETIAERSSESPAAVREDLNRAREQGAFTATDGDRPRFHPLATRRNEADRARRSV